MALHSVTTIVAMMYSTTQVKVAPKNSIGYSTAMTIKTKVSSNIIGKILNTAILKIWANDYEPLDTILITLPVSLDKWKAKLWCYTWLYTMWAMKISELADTLAKGISLR